MFLSTLLVDTGANPDRPRPGRLWLRNLYRVHQRLCMAFPSARRKDTDRDFLRPYTPADFPEDRSDTSESPASPSDAPRHVHVRRSDQSGFLFRVDPLPGGRAVILVLSALEPDWNYAFRNAGYLLVGPPAVRPYRPEVVAGQRFRFRLRVNAVFRAREASKHPSGEPIDKKWAGKRIGVPGDQEALRNWLDRRAQAAGFVVQKLIAAQAGYAYVSNSKGGTTNQHLRSVCYDGILEVADVEAFRQALVRGIGPAKAFGFGLLSIAPLGEEPRDAL